MMRLEEASQRTGEEEKEAVQAMGKACSSFDKMSASALILDQVLDSFGNRFSVGSILMGFAMSQKRQQSQASCRD